MSALAALIRRDLVLAVRLGGGAGTALGFFLVVVSLVPLAIGPDLRLLARIAPGALWLALLLSVLLSVERIFQPDHEDGSLDVMALSPMSLELVFLAKAAAHWLSTGLVLVIAVPLLGLLLNLRPGDFAPLTLAALIGSPALSLIGAFGAALTIGVRRGGLLVSMLVLPLYVPVLIFGVLAGSAAQTGEADFAPPALVLTALTLAAVVLAPIAGAAALRAHLR